MFKEGGSNRYAHSEKLGSPKGEKAVDAIKRGEAWSLSPLELVKLFGPGNVPEILLNRAIATSEPKSSRPTESTYLARREQFVEVMRSHGYIVHAERWPYTVEWPGMEADFQRFSSLEQVLNNPDLSDEAFRQVVRSRGEGDSIEEWLRQSLLFAQLGNPNANLTKNNTILPLEHVLAVDEQLQTAQFVEQGIPQGKELVVVSRWLTFFHDLAKAVDASDPGHGAGSAMILNTFFQWKEQQRRLEGKESPYSPVFVEQLLYLCEFHHLFAELSRFLSKEIEMSPEREEALFTRNTGALDRFYRWYISSEKTDKVIALPEFTKVFARMQQQPQLIKVLHAFTAADVGVNPLYQKYIVQNHNFARILELSFLGQS